MKLWFSKATERWEQCSRCEGKGVIYSKSNYLITMPEKIITLPYICLNCEGIGKVKWSK